MVLYTHILLLYRNHHIGMNLTHIAAQDNDFILLPCIIWGVQIIQIFPFFRRLSRINADPAIIPRDNDEWESYRKIFDFIPEPPESNIPPCK